MWYNVIIRGGKTMNFEETNIQNLQELKSGLLKENDKIQRLQIFAKGDKVGIEHLEEIENMSTEDTIGANYYLAQYLSQFTNGITPGELVEENESKLLENQFMKDFLPFLTAKSKNVQEISNEIDRVHYFYEAEELRAVLAAEMANDNLKEIVDKLARLSMKKLVNKQPLSEKDYGFIVYKIALWIGDFLDYSKYNMLYLGLYHELSQGKNFGSFAESYLKDMVLSKGLVDSRFYPENETKSTKR